MSLAGIPPTAGFFGKWYLLKSAMDGGFHWLAIIMLVNSVLGAYYYLRVLVFLYMREPAPGAAVATPMKSGYVAAALILAGALVIVLGLSPDGAIDLAAKAALAGR
jgi:NADH-quinone oxidoreductase subunit N